MDQSENASRTEGRSALAWITDKVALLLVLVAGATLAAYLGRIHFLVELATHFRVLYLAAAIALTVFLLLARSWRWAMLGVAVVALNIAPIAPYCLPGQPTTAAPNLRILEVNVLSSNQDHERLISLVRRLQPDVVVLLEVDAIWMRALSSLRSSYPYAISKPQHDNFGIAVISRLPFTSQRIFEFAESRVPAISAQVKVAGRPVNVLALHTFPPGTSQMARTRDAQLRALARLAQESPEAIIACGDFNATPWSPIFKDTVADSGLKDARLGFGFQGTWPAQYAPCLIPLDHCLVSSEIGVRSFRALSEIGSDHLPVLVELVIPPAPE